MRVGILSVCENEQANFENDLLARAVSDLGHTAVVLCLDSLDIQIKKQNRWVLDDDGNIVDIDALIPRINPSDKSIVSNACRVVNCFESLGIFTTAKSHQIRLVKDKLEWQIAMSAAGIATPDTIYSPSSDNTRTEKNLSLIEPDPTKLIVMKPTNGTCGEDITFPSDRLVALEEWQKIHSCSDKDFIMQRFIQPPINRRPYDYRAIVIGGEIITLMRRVAAKGELKSNLSQYGLGFPCRVTKKHKQFIKNFATVTGLFATGLDYMEDFYNEDLVDERNITTINKNFMAIEENSGFGFKISQITGEPVHEKLALAAINEASNSNELLKVDII